MNGDRVMDAGCFTEGNELRALAQQLPGEWVVGSEVAWRDYALSVVLRRTGTDMETARGRVEVVIALGALAELGRCFWARVNGEADSEPQVGVEDLAGEWPKAAPHWIGYLARDLDVWEDATWEEPRYELALAVTCLLERAMR